MLVLTSSNLLKKSVLVYDSTEQNLEGVQRTLTSTEQDVVLDLGALTQKEFKKMRPMMREEDFSNFLSNNGFALLTFSPDSFFDRFKGSRNLPLYFDLLPSTEAGLELLVVGALGEFQPGRYMVFIEGLWKVRDEL